MPDDQEVTEQKQTEEDGFADYTGSETETEAQKEDETQKEDAAASSDAPAKEPEDNDGEQDKPEKTAMERMLEDLSGEGEEGQREQKAEDGKKPPEETATAKTGSAFTKEAVGDALALVEDLGIPDKTIVVGDNEVDLAKYRKDYPDEFNSVAVMAVSIAKRIVEQHTKTIGDGKFLPIEEAQTYVDKIQDLASELWWVKVESRHEGAREIAASQGFMDWVKTLPASVQKKVDASSPAEAIKILDAYKEATDTSKAKGHDEKAKADKQKKDGLLGGGVRSSATPHRTTPKPEQRGEADGFDDYAKEKAKRG